MAIFGPQDDYIAEHIKSITDMIEVPFIDTRYMEHFSVPINILLSIMILTKNHIYHIIIVIGGIMTSQIPLKFRMIRIMTLQLIIQ